jgi:exodeoxyribonuclease VII large subunit
VRDVLKVAARRFPGIPILIAPTLVQGEDAPDQIARALHRIGAVSDVDVVLLVRGGGSIEDLWAFNTEVVARAIHDCPIPVVSGVGHETDVTIADLVADVRGPTPSAAAMLAIPDRRALSDLVARDVGRLRVAVERRVESRRDRVRRLHALLGARSPRHRVALARTREARVRVAAVAAIQRRIDRVRRALGAAAARLDALSPLAVLGRGYALARREADGRIVRSTADVSVGDRLRLQLASGRLGAEVTDLDPASAASEPAPPASAPAPPASARGAEKRRFSG